MESLTSEEMNLETMSKASNYNKWIFDNIKGYLGKSVLEIGGGIGNMTSFFVDRSSIVSTDITSYNVDKLKDRFESKAFSAVKTDISKGVSDLAGFSFDTVVCINVLEHIENDSVALRNMSSVLNIGGKLVLLVPAFNFLYGTIDKSDNHYRRYDRSSICRLVGSSGFKVAHCAYMNVPGFFGWYYHGKILKKDTHPSGDISLFDRLVPAFSFVERILKPPFGLSLIVIADKI
ncbi:MAG: class I SAM-dependent methyltransferase [archaeon]